MHYVGGKKRKLISYLEFALKPTNLSHHYVGFEFENQNTFWIWISISNLVLKTYKSFKSLCDVAW